MMNFDADPAFTKEIDEALIKFEASLGLPPPDSQNIPKDCLFMPLDELRKKNIVELAEFSYLITQHSLNIQRLINKYKSWERWTKAKLDEVTASYIPEVGEGYGFNERILMARHTPELCKKLNSFLRKVQMHLDRLYGIPDHIKMMAENIRDLRYAMQKNNS